MEQFYQLAHAFMHQDLVTLSDPKMAFMVCGVLLTFLVLENGFIPTAFLVPFNSSGTGAGTMMNFVNACGGGGTWVGFCGDGVSVLNGFASLAEISVPEPASAWLTAVAALAMLGVRRTRRQSMR